MSTTDETEYDDEESPSYFEEPEDWLTPMLNGTYLRDQAGFAASADEEAQPREGFPGGEYPENWKHLATALKQKRGWRCEVCKFTSVGSSAIHVHHISQDKSDNADANLQVLCAICHGEKHGQVSWVGVSAPDKAMLEAWHKRRGKL